jgi:RNA polymerase sigma-70 factor (ECF subfamily)
MDTTLTRLATEALGIAQPIDTSGDALPVPTEWWAEGAGEAAFEGFVLSHRRRVFGLLLGCLGDADEAEDLTQEVFLRAWRARRRYRPQPDPWPWLATIALNTSRDLARYHGRRPRVEGSDVIEGLDSECAKASPAKHAELREDLTRVRAALSRLPPRQREVLVLCAFAGLGAGEIAAALGLRANAVRVSLHHARRNLRALLDAEEKSHD